MEINENLSSVVSFSFNVSSELFCDHPLRTTLYDNLRATSSWSLDPEEEERRETSGDVGGLVVCPVRS